MAATSPGATLSAFGFGPGCGEWGGTVVDALRVPHADHMLVPVPDGVDPLRVAAASDNLADWQDAPEAYAARTTKLVLHRPPLDLGA